MLSHKQKSQACRRVNYYDQVEMVAWTALFLRLYMFLRKSNMVPDTMTIFNKQQQFCKGDINLLGLDKAIMVKIRWSKTIQISRKFSGYQYYQQTTKQYTHCSAHYMVNTIAAKLHEPAFSLIGPTQSLALSYNQLIYRFRKWLKLINQDPSIFSLYSLRREEPHLLTKPTWKGK